MPFTANYTVLLSADGSNVTVTDISDYSVETPSTFFARRFYLAKADGTFVKPSPTSNYFDFPFATNIITIPLDVDLAANVILELVPLAPVINSVYTKQVVFAFINRLRLFSYSLTQSLASNPSNLKVQDFRANKYDLQSNINDCEIAAKCSDIANAQASIYRANKYRNNPKIYF